MRSCLEQIEETGLHVDTKKETAKQVARRAAPPIIVETERAASAALFNLLGPHVTGRHTAASNGRSSGEIEFRNGNVKMVRRVPHSREI